MRALECNEMCFYVSNRVEDYPFILNSTNAKCEPTQPKRLAGCGAIYIRNRRNNNIDNTINRLLKTEKIDDTYNIV